MSKSVVLFLMMITSLLMTNEARMLKRRRRSFGEAAKKNNELGVIPVCTVRQWNITVQPTDNQGRSCRGEISVNACYGMCMSSEIGTETFPYSEWNSNQCLYNKTRKKVITLTDCDEGIDDELKTYEIDEAVDCKCAACNPETTNCQNQVTKRTKKTTNRPKLAPATKWGSFADDYNSDESEDLSFYF